MRFIKLAAVALCCVCGMTLASCDKDDDPKTSSKLKFSTEKAEVAVGKTVDVTVSGGTEAYTAKSGDEKTATVKVSKSVITVTGVKAGTATITVTDKNKLTGTFTVTVKEATTSLEFDQTSVSVETGKEETVTVKSGTAPYTATVKDTDIATATVEDGKITIKGVKAGTTTVTVTDKDNLTGTVSVTVK